MEERNAITLGEMTIIHIIKTHFPIEQVVNYSII